MRIQKVAAFFFPLMLIFPASAHGAEEVDPLTLPDTETVSISLSELEDNPSEDWATKQDFTGTNAGKDNDQEISPMGGVADTWAPGGAGARVSMTVRGTGNVVNDVNLGYWAGVATEGSNACLSDFEVSYYGPFNAREVQHKTHHACVAPWTAANQWFTINQHLYSHTPICGRVKVNNEWSPYACLQIIP